MDMQRLRWVLRKRWKRGRKWLRRRTKAVEHLAVFAVVSLMNRLVACLPLRTARKLGAALGGLGFRLARGECRAVLENLELAYGNAMSEQERLALARRIFINAGMTAAEWPFLTAGRAKKMLKEVRVEGEEHLRAAQAKGGGLLFLTAHYGNWELMTPLMTTLVKDRETGVVARDLSNPWLNDVTVRTRRSHGARVFPRGSTGRDYVRFLRDGNGLAVLGDVDTDKGGGIFVDFFGKPAWTQSGIARLAYLGRAKILPVFIKRDSEDPARHVVTILPPLAEPENATAEEYVVEMTQALTGAIERAVRERPDQWMWMHRRWRRQPEPDVADGKAAVSDKTSPKDDHASRIGEGVSV
jgi:Kdo2-lipid IVA lauroyltransferase/acyltransferase